MGRSVNSYREFRDWNGISCYELYIPTTGRSLESGRLAPIRMVRKKTHFKTAENVLLIPRLVGDLRLGVFSTQSLECV